MVRFSRLLVDFSWEILVVRLWCNNSLFEQVSIDFKLFRIYSQEGGVMSHLIINAVGGRSLLMKIHFWFWWEWFVALHGQVGWSSQLEWLCRVGVFLVFFISSKFFGLLSCPIFSNAFALVCFSTAWSDYGGQAFARVSSRLSFYFSGESI